MHKLQVCLVSLFLLIAFQHAATAAEDVCDPPPLGAKTSWLPIAPKANTTRPPRHSEGGTDCPFYKGAWQRFLYVTQPSKAGRPAFLGYASIEDLFSHRRSPMFARQSGQFLSLAPRGIERPNVLPPKLGAGINQAKLQGILVDRFGHPIFYAIHVNREFRHFLRQHKLNTPQELRGARQDLAFPPGIVELKSAWEVVSDRDPPANYFTTRARVPWLSVVNGEVEPTAKTRIVTVALLALHVAFTLDHHPELVWSTFEHVDKNGHRDNAPAAPSNPPVGGNPVICETDYPLCKKDTRLSDANQLPADSDYAANFDETHQTFDEKGRIFSTPIYRLFPGSKSNGSKPHDSDEDGEVISINSAMRKMFEAAQLRQNDRRANYQLVGAVWIDNPIDNPGANFALDRGYQNPSTQSTDDPASVLAGEGRLSSTAIESFTQDEGDQPNCFSCHDTHQIKRDVAPYDILVGPKLLNVSHIVSKFLSGAMSQGPGSAPRNPPQRAR